MFEWIKKYNPFVLQREIFSLEEEARLVIELILKDTPKSRKRLQDYAKCNMAWSFYSLYGDASVPVLEDIFEKKESV